LIVASLWRGTAPLLLASTSRVRRTLLEGAGVPVETVSPSVDERTIEAALGPEITAGALASHLARQKAEAVARSAPDRVVIGADQVLDLDGECLGKPGTPEGAQRQIFHLAGRTHTLHSAVAIYADGRLHTVLVDTARLTLRDLDETAIGLYVETAGEAATRSAGGYEIEGLGIHLFTRVEGEHSTILGLPLLPTLAALRELRLLAL
jgi:septum formation protein